MNTCLPPVGLQGPALRLVSHLTISYIDYTVQKSNWLLILVTEIYIGFLRYLSLSSGLWYSVCTWWFPSCVNVYIVLVSQHNEHAQGYLNEICNHPFALVNLYVKQSKSVKHNIIVVEYVY